MAEQIEISSDETTEKPKKKSIGYRLLRALLIGYLGIVMIMMLLERQLVYPVPPIERSNWTPDSGAFEEIEFLSSDETKLHGWYYHHSEPRYVFLYCHGNGEQVPDSHGLMLYLQKNFDAAVMNFDYRGYGKSEGKPYEKGLVADGIAAQKWLANKTNRKPEEIILIGRSIGGGVATAVATSEGAKALILQSTFTSLPEAASNHFPWLPVKAVMRNRFNSLAKLPDYSGPILLSHGTADRVVPYSHGEQLFEAALPEKKRFFSIPGGGHNDPQPTQYYAELSDFLQEYAQDH